MDTQGHPIQPRYQLTRDLIGLDNEKRCYDVTLSRQEASTMRHLASAHQGRPASMHAYRMTFSVIWRAGLRRPD